jgi:ATP-dependent Lhr-like helicase
VREETWPDPVNAEELHDALLWLSCLTEAEAKATPTWCDWLEALSRDKRVTRLKRPESTLWIPAERLSQFRAVWPQAQLQPEIAPPPGQEATWAADQALIEILRGRLEGLGPVTQIALAAPFALEEMAIAGGLAALESDGTILRGRFDPGVNDEQWCDRRLLARIHHTTIRRLR